MSRTKAFTKLRGEQLEPRHLLAGNVNVTVNGSGDVSIQGDKKDNCVEVQEVAGSIQVTGCLGDADTDNDTTINGVPGPFVSGLLVRDLTIDLKDGDDGAFVGGSSVEPVAGITVPRILTVKTGDGADFIGAVVNVGGKTNIDTGNQGDGIGILNSVFTGGLEVKTGKGDDEVFLTDVEAGGTTKIETSDGEDVVNISSTGLAPPPGPNIPDSSSFHDLEIKTGDHDDIVTLIGNGLGVGVEITDDLDIESGKGNDKVHLFGTFVTGETEVETTDGNDCVEIVQSIFEDLEIELGKGNDHLLFFGTLINGDADLDGSKGSDTFYDAGENDPADLIPFLEAFEKLGNPANFPCPLFEPT